MMANKNYYRNLWFKKLVKDLQRLLLFNQIKLKAMVNSLLIAEDCICWFLYFIMGNFINQNLQICSFQNLFVFAGIDFFNSF